MGEHRPPEPVCAVCERPPDEESLQLCPDGKRVHRACRLDGPVRLRLTVALPAPAPNGWVCPGCHILNAHEMQACAECSHVRPTFAGPNPLVAPHAAGRTCGICGFTSEAWDREMRPACWRCGALHPVSRAPSGVSHLAALLPPPTGTGRVVVALVLAELPHLLAPADAARVDSFLRARAALGLEKYGRPLQTCDGQDSITAAAQEMGDAVKYLRKAVEEGAEHMRPSYLQAVALLAQLLRETGGAA